MDFKNGLKTMFGYNAVVDKGRRKAPKARVQNESKVLSRRNREKLVATIKDISRNDPVVGWALRKHLDYVSTFTFQAKTNDSELNKLIEKAWKKWSKKESCDIAKRHNLNNMMRMFESGKAFDGDSAMLKIKGFKLQGVESDRIGKSRNIPKSYEAITNDEGLILDQFGAVKRYIINKRSDSGQLLYQTSATPNSIVFDGYFQRFDQLRGISPMASAVNTFLDVVECNEALLLKCKKHGMFGLAIMSDGTSESGFGEMDEDTDDEPDADTERYDFEMSMGYKLELDAGDKIDMFESKTPSNEYQDYVTLMLRIALLAFDIPYTFFNSQGSSYSANKQDRAEYELSAGNKRQNNLEVLENIADWVLPELLKDIEGAPSEIDYEFIPQGTPWIDELKEVQASQMRISAGISNRTLECKKKGLDFVDINEQAGREEKTIIKNGVSVVIGQPGQQLIGEDSAE
ncbi:MAG: phage portal protein [Lentisphaerae bacterium]|nr:phage portal protein [Lentisphaerota bacterium]